MSMIIAGIIVFGVGYLNPFGLKFYGFLLFNIGLVLVAIGAWGLPTLTELDWKPKIQALYGITSGGVCAFEYSFIEREKVDSQLVSSGLTGVVNLVKEITKSAKKPHTIRQEKRNILLEYGEFITLALIAEEELAILHNKLNLLLQDISLLYDDILPTWRGNLEVFKPVEGLIKKFFQ